ncbi:WD-40 repeat-containing protein [Gloeothece citriformis PCC 7424]|uniref:WD-40 repeat-containing protein n=1 Tax=Gloeothece citriformis (strain PCC 7424) TaxID=65393 RepID=B7K8A7_GLOC7|nr:serine protease [Gloeothece citriformis]ACK69867.1 WD-40 repeat-containing protein [Gloeothece citriformis PCC 7424]
MHYTRLIPAFLMGLVGAFIPLSTVRGISAPLEMIAQNMTVRLEGRTSVGTGVFVERQGKTYYILTSDHVVKQPGNYIIVAPDRKCYQVSSSSINRISGLDLAVIPLTSNLSYQIANLGNSDQLTPGQNVYVSGWTRVNDLLRGLVFFGSLGEITEVNSKLPQGYSITYTNLVRVGMSGGGILDEQGRLIGINGLVRYAARNSDTIVASGIGINQFLRWRSSLKKPLSSPLQEPKSCSSY